MTKQTINTFLTQTHSHTWTKSFWEGNLFLNIYNFYKRLTFQKGLASKKKYQILYYLLIIWMILLWMDFNHIGYKFCASRLHHCLFEAFTHCHAPFKCVFPQHPPQKSLSVCQEITYYQLLSHWTLKSSAVEWIVRMSLLSGTTDLLRTCYFPL